VAPEPETIRLCRSIRGRREAEASTPPAGGSRDGGQRSWATEATQEGAPQGGGLPREARSNPSIAVLPFANIGGDPEQEYFADGLTEDIITDLSRSQPCSSRRGIRSSPSKGERFRCRRRPGS
jgi:hypothetical protein